MVNRLPFEGDFRGKFAREIFELIQFQNKAYAARFVDYIEKVYEREKADFPAMDFRFTKTVADNLYDLMAFKDEYRVAELLTRPEAIQKLLDYYEEGEVRKVRFLLRPPILQKIPLVKDLPYIKEKFERDGKWEVPGWMLTLLKHFKFLRGTGLDFLAWRNDIRKLEHQAANVYKQRIDQLLPLINEGNYADACEAASYPSIATGYEHVKEFHTKQAENCWRNKILEIKRGEFQTGVQPEPVQTL